MGMALGTGWERWWGLMGKPFRLLQFFSSDTGSKVIGLERMGNS